MKRVWTEEELREQWSVSAAERAAVSKKSLRGRLHFVMQLQFFRKWARFPRSRSEIAPVVLRHLASQLGATEEELSEAERWTLRSGYRHRRAVLAFLKIQPWGRGASEELQRWLATEVWPTEPSESAVEDAVSSWYVTHAYERPPEKALARVVGSARKVFEREVQGRVVNLLSAEVRKKLDALVMSSRGTEAPIMAVREDPGRVGLKTFLAQAKKVKTLQAIGLPDNLLAGMHPETVRKLRRRSANEQPSELRSHPAEVRFLLLGVECAVQEGESIDQLVDALLQVIKRMMSRAEKRVKERATEYSESLRGRMKLLHRVACEAHAKPEGAVKDVIAPLADDETWRALREEEGYVVAFKRRVHDLLRASYGQHYRRLLPKLLEAIEFRSNNAVYKPLIKAIEELRKPGERPKEYVVTEIPMEDVVRPKWREIVVEQGSDGKERISRLNYELCVLESLRERLRSREVWIPGSVKYRNPDDDLPADFASRRAEYLGKLGLPLTADEFVEQVKTALREQLQTLDRGMPKNRGVKIIAKRKKQPISVTPLKPVKEPANLELLKAEVTRRWPTTALLDVLKEADLRIGFTKALETSAARAMLSPPDLQARQLMAIFGLGTNAGMSRLMTTTGISYRELLHVKRMYIDKDGLREAARRVVNATLAIRRPEIWGEGKAGCAGDSTQVAAFDQNLMTEWHVRYGGRGVMIYWHVERKALCLYSQLKRVSSSEVASMIEGLLRHRTDVDVGKQYVDSHGQSEVGFAFCRLFSYDLLPRMKAIGSQRLYVPDLDIVATLPNLRDVLSRQIDWDTIRNQYDEMVKYAVALQEGRVTAESALGRFTRNNGTHPTYRALSELGKAVKTIFVCRYLASEELRREIHQALNVVENWNSANNFIFFGRAGEVQTNRHDEQELAVHALHLVQSCLVYVNTLMLQRVLDEPEWTAKLGDEERRALTPLIWEHIYPYGRFELDMQTRIDLEQREAA